MKILRVIIIFLIISIAEKFDRWLIEFGSIIREIRVIIISVTVDSHHMNFL